MFARRKFAFYFALVLLVAIAVLYELRVVGRQRENVRAWQARRFALARELEQTRATNAADTAALADLRQDLARANIPMSEAAAKAAAETQAWLAKLATVKRLFAKHPESAIPELQLLEMRAWLGTVKNLPFDGEDQIRKSLAAVRSAAKKQFTMQLSFALRKYLNTRDGELPPDVLALATYFNPPMDPAILGRYKMTRSGNMAALASELHASDAVVLERSPVDEDFDTRHGVNVGRMGDGSGWGVVPGSFGGLGPTAWIDDYQDRLKRAQADFSREHPGAKPNGLADVVSYMNPPLDAAVAEKIIQAEKDRGK